MSKALVIVESPAKMKTIKRYLGDDYLVESSVGHVKDLPKSNLGVQIEKDFAPEYEVISDKKKVMQKLKKAAKQVEHVYLALDPDREGEAIAWHIAEELRRSRGFKADISRILFHEITKRAILEALKQPGELNQQRFDAQQARADFGSFGGIPNQSCFVGQSASWLVGRAGPVGGGAPHRRSC